MKKTLFLFTLIVSIITQSISAQEGQPKLQVKSGDIIINKTKIKRPWSFDQFTSAKALGKSSRENLGGGNDIFTYDASGIMLYRASNKNIMAFNIYFGLDESEYHDFNPSGYYKGKIMVEKFAITSSTSIAEVKKALPQYKFEMSLIEAYRGEYNGLYIYLRYNQDETKILWSSIGRNDYY